MIVNEGMGIREGLSVTGETEVVVSVEPASNGPSLIEASLPNPPVTEIPVQTKAMDIESVSSVVESISTASASASKRVSLATLTCEQCINLLYAIGCKSIEDIFSQRHITGEDLCYVESMDELKDFGLPLIAIQLRKFYTKLCEWKTEGVPEDLLQTQYVQEVIVADVPIVANTSNAIARSSEAKGEGRAEVMVDAMDVSMPSVDVAGPNPSIDQTKSTTASKPVEAEAKQISMANSAPKPPRKKEKSAKEIQAEKQLQSSAQKSLVMQHPVKRDTAPAPPKRPSRTSEVVKIIDDNEEKALSKRPTRKVFEDEDEDDDEEVRRSKRSSANKKSFVDLFDSDEEGLDTEFATRSSRRSESSKRRSSRSSTGGGNKVTYRDESEEELQESDIEAERERADSEARAKKKARTSLPSNPPPVSAPSTISASSSGHTKSTTAGIALETPSQVLNVLKIINNMQTNNAEAHLRSILQVQKASAAFNASLASTPSLAENLLHLLEYFSNQDILILLELVFEILATLFVSFPHSNQETKLRYGKERRHAINEFVEANGYQFLLKLMKQYLPSNRSPAVTYYSWLLIQHGSEKLSFRKQIDAKTMISLVEITLKACQQGKPEHTIPILIAIGTTLLAFIKITPLQEFKILQKGSSVFDFLSFSFSHHSNADLMLLCCQLISHTCQYAEDSIRDGLCLRLIKDCTILFDSLRLTLQIHVKQYTLVLEAIRVVTHLLFLEESLPCFLRAKISSQVMLCMKQYLSDAEIVKEVSRVIVNASCDSIGQEHFAALNGNSGHGSSSNGIPNVAELFTAALRTHVNHVQVVDEICRAITNLAVHERNQSLFHQSNACEMLMKVLKRYSGASSSSGNINTDEKQALEQICRSITNMTLLPANKKAFTELKLISIFLELLSKLKPTTLHAGIIRRILLSLNNLSTNMINNSLQVLSYPQSPNIFMNLCTAYNRQDDMVTEICAVLAVLLISNNDNTSAFSARQRSSKSSLSSSIATAGVDAVEEPAVDTSALPENEVSSTRIGGRNRVKNHRFEDRIIDANNSKMLGGSAEDSFAQRFVAAGGLNIMFKFAREYIESDGVVKDIACILSALINRTAGEMSNVHVGLNVKSEKLQKEEGMLSSSEITTMINLIQLHISETDLVRDVVSGLTALIAEGQLAEDRQRYGDMLFEAGVCEVIMEVLITYDNKQQSAATTAGESKKENDDEEENPLVLANVLDVIADFLMKFCVINRTGRMTFLSFSLLDLFVKYMQQYMQDPEILTMLCGALHALVCDDIEGKRKLVHQLDTTDLVMVTIRSHANQVELLHFAIDLLLELIAVPTVIQVLQHGNSCKILIQVLQVHVALIKQQQEDDRADLIEKVCQLIFEVAYTDVTSMALFVEMKLIETLTDVLKKLHPAHDSVAMIVKLLELMVTKLSSAKDAMAQCGLAEVLETLANSSDNIINASTRALCTEMLKQQFNVLTV